MLGTSHGGPRPHRLEKETVAMFCCCLLTVRLAFSGSLSGLFRSSSVRCNRVVFFVVVVQSPRISHSFVFSNRRGWGGVGEGGEPRPSGPRTFVHSLDDAK